MPEAVRSSVVALSERIARGDSPELAVALMPYRSKLALWAWWEVVMSGGEKRINSVMPGLVPGIHAFLKSQRR